MWNPQNYHADRLKKLGLNVIHVAILDWFLYFYKSDNMKLLGECDGKKFYWVTYKKICSDLLLPFSSDYKMNECFKELCGNGKKNENQYPLIKKVFSLRDGKKIGLAFRENVTDWLRGTEGASMPGFFDDDEKPKKITQKKRTQKVNKRILKIFEEIKLIEANGKKIFNHRSPDDENHYTSTYAKFQNMVYNLYLGHFLREYKLDLLSPWFRKKYSYYLDEKKIAKKISACKNDWQEIEKLLIESVKNYSFWFSPDSEVTDKLKLPKDINSFIFHPNAKTSMFYCCVLTKPTTYREAAAESVFENVSQKSIKIFNKIFQKEDYDGFAFWSKIKSLESWYEQYAETLCSRDSNCSYWLQNKTSFLQDYLAWIFDNIGEHPKLGNFGCGNKTFSWFVSDKIKTHSISIEIPVCTKTKRSV